MARARNVKWDRGTDTPANDLPPDKWEVGDYRENVDRTTVGLGLIKWSCTVAGRPGTHIPIYGSAGGPVLSAHPGSILFSNGDGAGGVGPIIAEDNDNLYFDNANNRVILGNGGAYTPVAGAPLTIVSAHSDSTAILLSKSGLQRIQKTNGKLDIVVPNTLGDFNFYMGTTKKITVEPGISGGSNSVITLNNSGVWAGTFAHWSYGGTFITGTAFSGSQVVTLGVTAGALTNQSGSVELNDVIFDLSHTVQQVGGVDHAAQRSFKILAPTYSSTTTHTIAEASTLYISGAPIQGTGITLTQKTALQIAGGGVRFDGLGSTGLVKNTHLGLLSIAAPGTDYVAPWSLTNESVVVSAGGATLTEDNASFFYRTSKHRLHALGQSVFGNTVGFWGAGSPSAPCITFNSETFDATEVDGAMRDTGFFGVGDNMFAATTGGFASSVFSSQGIATYGLQARYLYGGTENGRSDTSPLVIYGGSSTTLRGLQVRATSVFSATSGTQSGLYLNYLGAAGGFAPTSGTAAFRPLDLAYEVNQTGGANGTVTGINVDATVTALVGTHYLGRMSSRGRQYFRFEDQNTYAVQWIGEQSTGITGGAWLVLQSNARQALFELDNATDFLNQYSTNIRLTALAGSGTQLVQANPSGALSRSAVTMPTSGVIPSSTVALTGPAVVWTDSGGLLSVDTARFAYDSTNFQVKVPNGTALLPGVVPFGDTNTGIYSHGADALGVSTGGRLTARFTSDATSGFEYITGTSGFAYLGFEGSTRAGAIYLDNSVGSALITTVPFYLPNGSASVPSLAFLNSQTTGAYRYAAGSFGIAASGNHVIRFEGSATDRNVFIGASATGVTGLAYLGFETNGRSAAAYVDNTYGNALIVQPSLRVTGLAGTGNRFVVADTDGLLAITTAAVATSTSALTGPAVVWTNGSGLLNVDTARFTYDSTNFCVRLPNGSASNPSWTPIGDTNTGMYSHAADSLGVTTGGRLTAHYTSDSTSGYHYITGTSGFAYLGFEGSTRAGAIYLDNSVGNALITTVPFYVPNGSASVPALALVNSQTTGIYRFAANSFGIAASGVHVARFEGSSTDRNVFIGQSATGVTGLAYLGFETNGRSVAAYLDNTYGNALIIQPSLRVTGLAGTGDRIVGCDSVGLMSAITVSTGLSLSGGVLTATGGGGTVTAVTATTPIVSSGGTAPNITHANSGATAASYAYPSSVTVNATGHVTAIADGLGPMHITPIVFNGITNSMAATTYLSTDTADANSWTGTGTGPWYVATINSTNLYLRFWVTNATFSSDNFTIEFYKNGVSVATVLTIFPGDTQSIRSSNNAGLTLTAGTDTWGLVLKKNSAASGAIWISGHAWVF